MPNFSNRWSVSALLTSRLTLFFPFQHAMAISSGVRRSPAASLGPHRSPCAEGTRTEPFADAATEAFFVRSSWKTRARSGLSGSSAELQRPSLQDELHLREGGMNDLFLDEGSIM